MRKKVNVRLRDIPFLFAIMLATPFVILSIIGEKIGDIILFRKSKY